MHDYDAITRRAVFRNVDTRPRAHPPTPASVSANNGHSADGGAGNSKVVQKASSLSLDFEAAATALRDPAPLLAELEELAARAPADTAAKVRAFAKEHAGNFPKLLAGLDRLRALVPAAPALTDTPDTTE